MDLIEEDRARVILEVGEVELGVLYFERAKRSWTKKPLTNGWTCVDAKVQGLYIHEGISATPKELVAWCQELISCHQTGTTPTSEDIQGKLL